MSANDPLPVTILTGFLGSGKTTLLNRALRAAQWADTAVIINEFGEVGIDHLLVEPAFEDAILLKNGCICCTMRGDIADTLLTLGERRTNGSLPPFRRVVVETTGLADPAPVAQAIGADPAIRQQFALNGIVATADALALPEQLERHAESRRQLAFADRILLTKLDLASTTQLTAALGAIRSCVGNTPVTGLDGSAEEPGDLFDIAPLQADGPQRARRWLAIAGDDECCHPFEARGRSWTRNFRHGAAIRATNLQHTAPLAWERLCYWLDSLLSTRGSDVLRIKGLVHVSDHARPLVLQAVGHVVYPPTWLEREVTRDFPTEIVVIACGLSSVGLRASFAAVVSN